MKQFSSITNPFIITTLSTTPSTSTAPATSTAPTTTRQSICFIEVNINYQGNDIRGQGNVLSIADCCNLCSQTSGCFSWSYFVQYSYCYLKGAVATTIRQVYSGITSGISNRQLRLLRNNNI